MVMNADVIEVRRQKKVFKLVASSFELFLVIPLCSCFFFKVIPRYHQDHNWIKGIAVIGNTTAPGKDTGQ